MQTNFFHRGAGDGPHPRPQPQYDVPVTAGELKKIFSDCDDFETRTVRIGLESRLTVTVCWLDGVVSANDVSTDVLRPLTEGGRLADIASTREALHRIEQGAVYSCSTRTRAKMDDAVFDLTNGSVALVFDAQRKAVTFEVRTSNVRAVSEPTIEKSVSGAKDAFVETLRINTSLVRRKLHTPALKLQQTVVGRQSETTVAVLYVDGIADPARVQRILDRLDTIDEQALLGRDIRTVRRGAGCMHCNGTGYRGRVAVHEIVAVDRSIRRMISRGAEAEEIEAYAREHQGMKSLREKGLELVREGVTTPEELLRIAYYA